jgi:hypothetical protein
MKFKTRVDKKYTVWQRLDISFEAEDEGDARAALEKGDGLPHDRVFSFDNSETLYDTEEEILPAENGGMAVWELQEISKYE